MQGGYSLQLCFHAGSNVCYVEQLSRIQVTRCTPPSSSCRTGALLLFTCMLWRAGVGGLLYAFVMYCWSCHPCSVQKWLPHYRPRTSDLILNTEAANFNHPCLPRLPEDCQLDADSGCPGEAIFEKMTAGLYLGDIVRLILIRCDCRVLLMDSEPFSLFAALTVMGNLVARHTA